MNEAQGSAGINETNHWTIFGDPSLLLEQMNLLILMRNIMRQFL